MAENQKEYQRAVDYIINYVRTNNLKIGSKIPAERTLAEEIGVSRNSAREAIRYLENMGLLESHQGSGNYIKGDISDSLAAMMEMMASFNEFSSEDIYNFRRCVDKMICELLVSTQDSLDDILDEAENILKEETHSLEEEEDKDKRFHFHLINSTNNKLLITLLYSISDTYRKTIHSFFSFADSERKLLINEAHFKIVGAIRSRDLRLCSEIIDLHYEIASGLDQGQMKENLETPRIVSNADDLKYDSLTGLYTRTYFFKKVDEYVSAHPEQDLMMWTSDIIGLNAINEKYGFDMGDDILKISARPDIPDNLYIFGGRTEGDKFSALMIDNHDDFDKVNEIFAKTHNARLPLSNVTIKNGVYHINREEKLDAKSMYLRTVIALKEIKDDYDRFVMEYDEKFKDDMLMNRQIITDAREALERGDFKVYYQPKINVSKGCVGGAEALVRWIHPELGFMNPGVFIPVFEQNGFITKLDYYVWEEVCKSIVEWKNKGIPVVPVSINVSRRDFQSEDLAENIINLVDKYGLEHSLIEIEITESSFIDSVDVVKTVVKKLHESGFLISLDDFGTGYSSMISLSELELDIIKMDMSLIQNDKKDTKRNALEFSFQLAKMVNLITVAEGIETEEQVQRITSLGGDFIQGYFYSKPIPKSDFEQYLKKH